MLSLPCRYFAFHQQKQRAGRNSCNKVGRECLEGGLNPARLCSEVFERRGAMSTHPGPGVASSVPSLETSMPGVKSQGPSEAPKGAERMRQSGPLSHLLSFCFCTLGFSKLGLTMRSADVQRRRKREEKEGEERKREGERVLDLISLNLMQ